MLGPRLKTIASFIEKDTTVIDVGCDHGLLDIYLTLYNNNNCIATDISECALKQAKNNIFRYNLQKQIVVQVGDGLKEIPSLKDVQIVLAGMGTETILKILSDERIYDARSIIISTHTELELLRKKMILKGFIIEKEKVVIENYKFYVVIKFIKGKKKYSLKDYYLGPLLKNNTDYDTIRYYESLLKENEKIIKKIPSQYSKKNKVFLKHNEWILEIIEKKLGPYYWK